MHHGVFSHAQYLTTYYSLLEIVPTTGGHGQPAKPVSSLFTAICGCLTGRWTDLNLRSRTDDACTECLSFDVPTYLYNRANGCQWTVVNVLLTGQYT